MKQALYCTSFPGGDANGLCQIRAFTPGLATERLQALLPLARFAPPAGAEPDSFCPVRLALVRSEQTGRCVLHSMLAQPAPPGSMPSFPALELPASGDSTATAPAENPPRLGLSHVLFDLPTMVDPQQVLFSWGSDQWQRHDLPGPTDLTEALFVPVSGHFSEGKLVDFLREAAGRELFEFLLAAYLSTPAETPIFLAAPPERIAMALYGLTKALPLSILEGLTFSTYEVEPTQARCRIVGTCWPDDQARDLPPACYDGLGVAFNAFSGTKTGLNTDMPFVRFATDNLVSGRPTALDEFHSTWQRLGVKDLGMLDLVYRLAIGGGSLEKAESQRAMQDPALSAWVATHAEAMPQLLQWALEDTDFATVTFSRAVAALRQKGELLAKVSSIVHSEGLSALKSGNLLRTRNALELVLPMVAPAKAAGLWTELFEELRQPEELSWDIHGYLLPRLAKLRPLPMQQEPDERLRPWLEIPNDNLTAFLAVDLPQSYHLAGLAAAERRPEATPAVARALAGHANLVLPLLGKLGRQPEGESRAVELFQAVLAESPRPWLEDLVRAGRTLPPKLLDRCVQVTLRQPGQDLRALVRQQGDALLEHLGGQSSLEEIAASLLAEPGAELLADEAVCQFLEKLAGQTGLSDTTWKRLDAFLSVRGYLKHPALHQENLVQVATAFGQEPPLFGPETMGRIVAAIGDYLPRAEGNPQEHLENVVLTLGPRFAGGPTPLYRALLRQVEQDRGFWKREDLLHAFVALALDAAKTEKVNEELNGLDPEAAHLVYQIKRHGGPKLLQALAERNADWPRTACRQWTFLTQSAQLSGTEGKSLFREAILVVAGAALATAVFALLRFLGYV